MKRLTLNQYRVLSGSSPTTQLRAARQLADLGMIEITEESRGFYSGRARFVEFVVTGRGREHLENAKSIRPYNRNRNREVYERHERGESYARIGRSLGIRAESARSLAATWRRYSFGESDK